MTKYIQASIYLTLTIITATITVTNNNSMRDEDSNAKIELANKVKELSSKSNKTHFDEFQIKEMESKIND